MNVWIEQYGYLAVFLGTFLEGETILIIAGFAAHRGYLDLTWVIGTGFSGTLVVDQLFYFLGRWHSEALLKLKPRWRAQLERVRGLINRYQIRIVLGFRFLYGFRTVTPFALGMSQVPMGLFIPLNILGALVWSIVARCGWLPFRTGIGIITRQSQEVRNRYSPYHRGYRRSNLAVQAAQERLVNA